MNITWTDDPYICVLCGEKFDETVHAVVHVSQYHTNMEWKKGLTRLGKCVICGEKSDPSHLPKSDHPHSLQYSHLLQKEGEEELFMKRDYVSWD